MQRDNADKDTTVLNMLRLGALVHKNFLKVLDTDLIQDKLDFALNRKIPVIAMYNKDDNFLGLVDVT